MSWVGVFTDELLELKRSGAEFEQAWEIAAGHHPPRLRELGGGGGAAVSLFELEARDSTLAWFKGACWDAWTGAPAAHGGRSRLHLLPGLMGAVGFDDSRSARRTGSYRAAS